MATFTFRLIAVIQTALGLGYLFVPDLFLRSMGHSVPAADLHYPLAMLAARFLAYGVGMYWASTNPIAHLPWIRLMGFIQVIDLFAGVYFTATGVVQISLSGFPMFNAVWIGVMCLFYRPASKGALGHAP